jgi:hypothetical protein
MSTGTKRTWNTIIRENDKLGIYIEIPPELLEALGWTERTPVRWSETEICTDLGEQQGLVLEKA